MYPQTNAIHFSHFSHFSRFGPQVVRSLSVRARTARMVTLGMMLLLAVGCGGGGSGGGQETPAAIASTPIDLPPGQTTATLEWAPSIGDVSGYFVLESRDGSSFVFANFAEGTEVEISGEAGDRVRIQVIARAQSGTFSAPSPPSVEVRFHPAAEAATTAATTSTAANVPDTVTAVALGIESNSGNVPEAPASDSFDDASDPELDPDDVSDAIDSIDQALRTRLLSADVRFPFRGHAGDASQWLQAHVDVQVGAGLSLVGTGRSDADAYRELVWTDQSGQLFVSDGAALAMASAPSAASDPTTTTNTTNTTTGNDPTIAFVEAIRLHATERFVGLADFDGDGAGDWLVEDFATGEVWMVNAETQEAIGIQGSERLLGHGDFDGDGRSELLWSDADGSLQITRVTTTPASVIHFEVVDRLEASTLDLETSRLLTVADLNGDGRDDLLFADSEGRLQAALSARGAIETTDLLFVSSIWDERSSDGLELIATLDLDGDGLIEIAWHDGMDLELWETTGAP